MASVTQSPPSASPQATQVVLTAQDVSKRYGNTTALAGIDVTVQTGEILGLVGHNGAGKSTLMRVLAGREQPDAGTVSWRGGGEWNQSVAARAGVRMVYQELALCPDLTVAENIALSDRAARGWGWRRAAERHVAEKLDRVFPGHGIAIVRRTSDLTMAQRQMVEIARALCTPDLAMLILDEPTESLSVDATGQLYAHLRELAASGVGMVLISHRMQEVLANADRIAVMKDGRIVDTVAARSTSEQALLSTMGGEVHADTATVRRVTSTERADIRQGGTVARITGRACRSSCNRARSSASPVWPATDRTRSCGGCGPARGASPSPSAAPTCPATGRPAASSRCGAWQRTSPSRPPGSSHPAA
ncbi:sugar ABC transporter ATP-binding protein [Microbacterium lushaniae]|uniref:Sugar ABC transporter ATP-binding protein n=1 Tax=Microbacterium lushaniae TaxID=2614639 RepID=A0A5J6L6E7_9MICO|nr:sugar ABC transporter ATP-binding protein [Microbacterium lushaniae]